jgi:predicted nucleic acid-binding protein
LTSLPVTSDAGPLIHLAKIGLLNLLRETFTTITIPSEVRAEVVERGKEKGFADAFLIEEAIQNGWIKVVDVKIPDEFLELCHRAGVDKGEAEALRYAKEKGGLALLDDESPRDLARSLGIPVKGTLGILVEAVRKGRLAKTAALKKLDELSDLMYMSGELYKLTRNALEQEA